MQGAVKDYKFGPKNNWRRALWNEVLRRTQGREKSEVILYMPGKDDLDRAVAVAKGVPSRNLIAVERHADTVDKLRADKVPVVPGDIFDVMLSWPANRPVCAVMLDMCGGFGERISESYDFLERAPFRKATASVNLLRGHDAWSNSIRTALSQAGLLNRRLVDMLPTPMPDEVENWPWIYQDDPKHRAFQFMLFHAFDLYQVSQGAGSSGPRDSQGRAKMVFPAPCDNGDAHPGIAVAVSMLMKLMNPRFFSYKSGALTYDSAVFNGHAGTVFDAIKDRALPERVKALQSVMENRFVDFAVSDVKRRIAAMFAVRTQRTMR